MNVSKDNTTLYLNSISTSIISAAFLLQNYADLSQIRK